MKDKQLRDSNYELLRIISMIFIITWHVIQHGQVVEHTTGLANMIFNMTMFFVIVHVNCFMLITGYYQSKSKFRLNKFISYILQIWFYNIAITSILSITGLIKINFCDYIINTAFFNLKSYWYIRCFLIVYILSPLLNIFIEKTDRKELKKLILIMLFCFSILPFFTGNLFYEETGYTVIQHILMYFVGAYIRKYGISIKVLNEYNDTQKKVVYILMFIFFWLINVMLYYFGMHLGQIDSNLCKFISGRINMYRYLYNSPIVIIQSLSIFLLFGKLKIKNKFINKLSSVTLGIYLIHENDYIKYNLYRWIGIYTGNVIYGNKIIIEVLLWIIIIFIGCAIIEACRKLLFFIISNIKFIKKISEKFQDFINEICEIH